MGTNDFNHLCSSCLNESDKCYGHNGYINLKLPLIHPLARELILKKLKFYCEVCKIITKNKSNGECVCMNKKNKYESDKHYLGYIDNKK